MITQIWTSSMAENIITPLLGRLFQLQKELNFYLPLSLFSRSPQHYFCLLKELHMYRKYPENVIRCHLSPGRHLPSLHTSVAYSLPLLWLKGCGAAFSAVGKTIRQLLLLSDLVIFSKNKQKGKSSLQPSKRFPRGKYIKKLLANVSKTKDPFIIAFQPIRLGPRSCNQHFIVLSTHIQNPR